MKEISQTMRDRSSSDNFLSKEYSSMMAGLAIIMMIYLHISVHPEWLDDGVEWNSVFGDLGKSAFTLLGIFCGICVHVYALLSGYALMVNQKAFGTWRKRISRLLKFLLAYWIVMVLFLIVGSFNGDTLPGVRELLYNLVGLRTGPEHGWINVSFAWYVCYYIEFIILSPLLIWAFSSKRLIFDIITAVIAVSLVLVAVKIPHEALRNLWPLISTMLGMLIAKYGIFNKLQRMVTGKLHWTLLVIAIVFIVLVRYLFIRYNVPEMILILPIMAAFLILFSVELIQRIRSRRFLNGLLILGNLSMFLWFLHSIFFTGKNFLQHFLFSFKEPLLILAVCMVILLPVAWLLKRVHGALNKRLF